MIKSLNTPLNQFSLSESLLYICKKPSASTSIQLRPQIDFLLLDQQIDDLQHIQSKTCQQIVEFVDQHREQFIKINDSFQKITAQICETQKILKNLIPEIVQYKQKHYSSQSKIQQFITNYQKELIKQKLMEMAKQQALFLIEFIKEFQKFINFNMEDLTHWDKYYIARILKKKEYLNNLFQHPIIKSTNQQYHGIDNLLDNVFEELEFYLSEQLSRLISDVQLRNQLNIDGLTLLQQMKTWYEYCNKTQMFYETIQDAILCRQTSSLQAMVISNKQALLTGKQQGILNNFYQSLFNSINNFPQNYPESRILQIVYKFLNKKQLNFQYSYVVPTFVISYNAYKNKLKVLKNQKIRKQMEVHHNWKLSLWAELRIKSIMDRSKKDLSIKMEGVLIKWIDIIFKKGFIIKGTKSYMIKLSMMLVNNFSQQLQDKDFDPKILNIYLKQVQQAKQIIDKKLKEGFQDQYRDQMENAQKQGKKIEKQQTSIEKRIETIKINLENTLISALEKWTKLHLALIYKNCRNSLENCKSFIMKVMNSKKQKKKTQINNKYNIMKPLEGFIKNNSDINQMAEQFLSNNIWQDIRRYYDSEYAKQIYNHSLNNLTAEQMKSVMETLSLQRSLLFQSPQKTPNQKHQNTGQIKK